VASSQQLGFPDLLSFADTAVVPGDWWREAEGRVYPVGLVVKFLVGGLVRFGG
jgi:hypothetical protein